MAIVRWYFALTLFSGWFSLPLVHGQTEWVTPDDVLLSAKTTYEQRRYEFTATTASQRANEDGDPWFVGFRGTIDETNASFDVVSKDKPISTKRGVLAIGPQAIPGDVIRIVWSANKAKKQTVVVYAGEESFFGKAPKHSFFIYPYRTQIEYNTLPPRKHRKYLEEYEKHASIALSTLFTFSDPDSRHGNTEWMEKSLFYDELLCLSSITNDTATYTIFRAKGNKKKTVFLTRKMPYYHQAYPASCFFALYTRMVAYYGKEPFAPQEYERTLIHDEILEPITPTQMKASRLFRQLLYVNSLQEAKKPKNDRLKEYRDVNWSGWDDPQLRDAIRDGEDHLGDWWKFAFTLRWQDFGLRGIAQSKSSVTSGELLDLIRRELTRDRTAMLVIFYEEAERLGAKWQGYEEVKLTQGSAGHWLLITGVRQVDDVTYLHFSTDFGFRGEKQAEQPKHGHFYAKWQDIYQLVPDEDKQMKFISVPANTWEGWSQHPNLDKVTDIEIAGTIPILIQFDPSKTPAPAYP